ncbi:PAS domain-containing protein, partial [Phaeodactylibacter sp.]
MKEKPALDAVDFASLFQLIMARGNDAVILFDKQGHVRYANPLAGKRLGYTNEALTQLQIFDLEEELNMVRYLQRWESAGTKKSKSWLVEWRLESGETQLFRIQGALFKNASPPLLCCFIPTAGSIQSLKTPTYQHLRHYQIGIWEWNIINGDFQM